MAMAAYVLALRESADAGLNARLYEARASLSPDGTAFLLRALARTAGTPPEQIEALTSSIAGAATREEDRATLREERSWWNDSTTRSTALALSALIEARPDHELIPPLARGLLHLRNDRGTWRTTQDEAYALMALADYARTRAGGTTRVTVRLGDQQLHAGPIEGAQIVRIERNLAQVHAGTLHVEADGPVAYTARVVLARPATADDAASHGFTIRREYLDFETHAPIERVEVGDLVTVRLAVRAEQDVAHVALVDPLPACFEVVNTSLATEAIDPSAERSLEHQYAWSHTELRDEEARAFAVQMGSGHERTFTYVARATQEGTCSAPGALVEAMYEPERYARTAGATIEVRR
jgi:uncharacterized protein YfaS (alpha-2-macroglobulin family)